MIIHLIKKDMLLAKKYLWFLMCFIIVVPIFLDSKLGDISNSFIILLVTSFFTSYLYYNAVETFEYKNNGLEIVKLLPVHVSDIVKAKYLAILILFVITAVVQQILSKVLSIDSISLSTFEVSLALLITISFMSILYPLLFKFGFEKTKFIGFIVVFLTPFILPRVVKNMNLSISSQTIQWLNSIYVPMVITVGALGVWIISIQISSTILKRKSF